MWQKNETMVLILRFFFLGTKHNTRLVTRNEYIFRGFLADIRSVSREQSGYCSW